MWIYQVGVFACVIETMNRCIHAIKIGCDTNMGLSYDTCNMLNVICYMGYIGDLDWADKWWVEYR